MKRLLNIALAVALIFSLATAPISATPTEANAKTTETLRTAEVTPQELEALKTMLESIRTATGEMMKTAVSQVTATLNISLSDSPISFSMVTLTDPVSHIFKNTVKAGEAVQETYSDPTTGLVYSYNENRKCYEFSPLNQAASGSIVSLDSFDSSLLEKISECAVFSVDPAAVFGEKPCTSLIIDIKAGEKVMKKLSKSLLETFGSTLGILSEILKEFKMKPSDMLKTLEATAHVYYDPATNILLGMDFNGTLGLNLGQEKLVPIEISGSSATELTAEPSVTLPDGVQNAVLAAFLTAKKGGLEFTSTAKGTGTVFSVTGVTAKKKKKLTIPATLSVCGTEYPVSAAGQNVFRIASKLKTLVIGDASLKKAIRKKPTWYGLPKRIKIK